MSVFKRSQGTAQNFESITDTLLLKDVKPVDPAAKLPGKINMVIQDGIIAEVLEKAPQSFDGEVIEGDNYHVMPGLFDMHVHLREPGREDEETILSGCKAAANGGFTGVACMPNTDPAIDTQEIVQYIKDQAKTSLVDVHPVAAITRKRAGEHLSPIAELVEAGAVAISDDGSPVMNAELMRRALEYSRMFDIPVLGHEEDINLAKDRHMHEGFYSTKLGIAGIPSISEEIMVARDIMLTEFAGGMFHVCHISTKGSIELVRQAKEKGLAVTCEVTPHHFSLTDQAVESFDTNTKMNPPLRSAEDKQAVIEALKDGTIDVIATDHAPHSIEEKEAEYIFAPFGITGLETALGLIMSELVHNKVISLHKIYDLCVKNPRKILNLAVPTIKKGEPANLTLFDAKQSWQGKKTKSYSRSQNTPFLDRHLTGKSVLVINNKRIFYSAK